MPIASHVAVCDSPESNVELHPSARPQSDEEDRESEISQELPEGDDSGLDQSAVTEQNHASERVEFLVEYANSRGLQPGADIEAGVITGVKILGLESRNGRVYKPSAIAEAAALYEGVKVNVNHPKGAASATRDYQDRLGCLRNVRATENGLFGDLHFNPHHPISPQLVWDAQCAPESVGLSHNVQARTSRRQGRTIVEQILKVNSVDLVADPATTSSLFESMHDGSMHGGGETGAGVLTVEGLRRDHPELVEAIIADHLSREKAPAYAAGRIDEEQGAVRFDSRPKSKGPVPDSLGESTDVARWARMIS